MSVATTKDGRHYCQYRLPHRRSPVKEYFGRGPGALEAAQRRDAEVKLLKQTGEEPRASSMHLDELAQLYIDHEKARGRSRKYLREIGNRLNQTWLPLLSGKPTEELRPADFDKLALNYQHLSPCTFNRYINYLNIIFNFGVEFEHIQRNPMTAWRKRVLKKETRRELTIGHDQVKAILACSPPHVYKAVKLAYETGCRPGPSELLKLKYTDIDFANGRIHIRGSKTAQSDRHVPLRKEFLAELRCWQFSATCDHIVEYNGKPVQSIKNGFNRAVKAAGITEHVVPYMLRHCFASTLIGNGADIKSVATLMGHSSPEMLFRVYSHMLRDGDRRAIEKLPSL